MNTINDRYRKFYTSQKNSENMSNIKNTIIYMFDIQKELNEHKMMTQPNSKGYTTATLANRSCVYMQTQSIIKTLMQEKDQKLLGEYVEMIKNDVKEMFKDVDDYTPRQSTADLLLSDPEAWEKHVSNTYKSISKASALKVVNDISTIYNKENTTINK